MTPQEQLNILRNVLYMIRNRVKQEPKQLSLCSNIIHLIELGLLGCLQESNSDVKCTPIWRDDETTSLKALYLHLQDCGVAVNNPNVWADIQLMFNAPNYTPIEDILYILLDVTDSATK